MAPPPPPPPPPPAPTFKASKTEDNLSGEDVCHGPEFCRCEGQMSGNVGWEDYRVRFASRVALHDIVAATSQGMWCTFEGYSSAGRSRHTSKCEGQSHVRLYFWLRAC